MTLAEFLLARIAEDTEAALHIADQADVVRAHGMKIVTGPLSPNRLLADCEAKRQLISDISEYLDHKGGITATDGLAWRALTYLALPYASHPDYQPEWAPNEE